MTKLNPTRRTRKSLTRTEIEAFFFRLAARDPEPKSELEWTTPFTLLIAVLLSAQATDKSVNRATRTLFHVADTPESLLALGEARLGEHIKTIGLFRTKARHVIALCRQLIDEFGGEVPRHRSELERLPGVGRKTANVVLNIAFGEATIAVDTHLFRVGNRTGLAPGKTPLAVETALLSNVPEIYLRHAHHWLILHGRYVCTARRPLCPDCPVRDLCLFSEKTPA